MTPKPPPKEMAAWLRRLEAANAKHKATKDALSEVIADARAAGVPLTTIEKHVSYSREWARKLADEVDARRAASEHAPPAE